MSRRKMMRKVRSVCGGEGDCLQLSLMMKMLHWPLSVPEKTGWPVGPNKVIYVCIEFTQKWQIKLHFKHL